MRHDGWALQFASRDLRNDRTVVEAACDQNAESLSFASPELRGDRSLVLRAVATSGQALEWASPDLRADPAVCAAACVGTAESGQPLPALRSSSLTRGAQPGAWKPPQ